MQKEAERHQSSRAALTLAALGVVFGDIGTSPLYAVKESFGEDHGIPLNVENVLGGLSTIFWAVMIAVSLKYVTLIMRADNKGEGGIMALLVLASSSVRKNPQWRVPIAMIGLLGASLFYGDAVLTPAISVLSAIEGLRVGTAALSHLVVPISVGVLIGLFALQHHGTATVGALFGPIMVIWFLALAAVGVRGIVGNPVVLAALDPAHALRFVTGHGFASFVVLGSVLLAFTGAEALYADMGHFGRVPIRTAWFGLVLPALTLNYFGQGAVLLADPKSIANPFYHAFPEWALYPMVGLATAATVIASQATISGTYSLTKQAIQLGLLPRMNIVQTSAREIGQIYLPGITAVLLLATIGAVLGFGSSSALASAYGVAVAGTMLVDTFLTFFVIRFGWGLNLPLCVAATGAFVAFDVGFFSSSLLKIHEGGWFPLTIGTIVFAIMATWRRGREILLARLRLHSVPLEAFLESLFTDPPPRVPGTAVFLTATPDSVPHALLHNLNHNKVLHERVVFLNVMITDEPWVPFGERASVARLGHGCFRVIVRFGFMNRPDVVQALELCKGQGLAIDMMQTSFFLSREKIVPVGGNVDGMALWRERMFAAMARNAGSITDFFNIPTNRVIELGTRIEI
ncbi:MAG: potassium transporter Kup [Betaproteobacteria bacterium]|nr:potassium transporter Kup [Betaproteobacteria bacterium]